MALIIKPKTKQQEKAVKAFLHSLGIDYTQAKEDAALYKSTPKKSLSQKEKKILNDLDKSVDFVNKYKKLLSLTTSKA